VGVIVAARAQLVRIEMNRLQPGCAGAANGAALSLNA